jgi:acyl dehydratase
VVHAAHVALARVSLGSYGTYVATDMIHEYYLPVRPGDILSYTMRLDKVSEEKKTRIGKGHFITTTQTYRNQRGEVVGKEIRVVLKYKAST